jgi:hypothetical protein
VTTETRTCIAAAPHILETNCATRRRPSFVLRDKLVFRARGLDTIAGQL